MEDKIMFRWKTKSVFFLLTLLIGLLANTAAASACNSHSILRTYVAVHGGYDSAVTVNLNANWSSTNHVFVLKTLWTRTDPNASWVEVGFMDGDLNGSNYHGFYTAYGVRDSGGNITNYSEFTVSGISTTVGQTHNFEVQYIGSNYWRAYVDATTVKDYYFSSTSGGGAVTTGWETGGPTSPYTNFTYDSPNSTSSQEYQDTSGVWHNWSSGTTSEGDNGCTNSTQMPIATFGTTSGSTDYTKGTFTHP
jgi:hypothetical protein